MSRSRHIYAWVVVFLLLIVWMLNYLDRQVIFSVFPLLQQELRISSLQLGLLGTAFLWVYSLCSPLAGHLADRFGRKIMICFSLGVWSIITVVTGHTHSFGELITLRSLMGVSEACYLPAGLALIAAYHGARTRSRAVSLHYSGTYLGTVLGGTLGGWIGATYGWRPVFVIFGAVGTTYALLLAFVLREPERHHSLDKEPKMKLGRAASIIFNTPGYRTVLTVFAIVSIADWAIYTWMPLYLFENFHYSLVKAGFTATFYIKIGGICGLLAGGLLADAWAQRSARGRIFTQCAGLVCAAPCLMLGSVTHSTLMLSSTMVIFGIGKGMYDGNTMPVLCEGIPQRLHATAFGFLNFAGTFAGGCIAAIAGALKERIGLSAIFWVCGALLLLAGIWIGTIHMRPARGDMVMT